MNLRENMCRALLDSMQPSEFFENLKQKNDFPELFPELNALRGLRQNPRHHAEGDVWTHTMLVLDEAAGYRERASYPLGFMLSALCHDFGKSLTTEEINGVIHSYDHEIKGLPLIRCFLKRFGFDDELTEYVLNMCLLHMKPNIIAADRSGLKASNRMFYEAFCPEDLIYLAACDARGQRPQGPYEENTEFLFSRLAQYRKIMSEPQVSEQDFIDSGISSPALIRAGMAYAQKLRLSGLDRSSALKQSLGYLRKL